MEPDHDKALPTASGPVFSPFPGLIGFASAQEQGVPAPERDRLDILVLASLMVSLLLLYIFYVRV